MDVARVLVEVDLTKPLPGKISFKGRDGSDVVVAINYPWLPPVVSCAQNGDMKQRIVKHQSLLLLSGSSQWGWFLYQG